MSFDNIKNLLIGICATIVLFLCASSLYIVRSNYKSTNANITEVNCIYDSKSKIYFCELTIEYFISNNKVTNKLIVGSQNKYVVGQIIEIEYDENNFIIISLKTQYRELSLFFSFCALALLIVTVGIYRDIKDDVISSIDKILSYISIFN